MSGFVLLMSVVTTITLVPTLQSVSYIKCSEAMSVVTIIYQEPTLQSGYTYLSNSGHIIFKSLSICYCNLS